jgi:MFS transporter, BCD family, chlorophyll transporter
LKLSVGATSALSGMLAGGALVGFVLAGRLLARHADPLRLAAYGALAGLPAFLAVLFSAPLDAGWLFRLGACGIGFGGGLFAVGTLYTAMRLETNGFTALALGAWGAIQSVAAGVAMFFGGALRDVVSSLAASGALGTSLSSPTTGYSAVYQIEIVLLFVTLIAIGPLVGRKALNFSEPDESPESAQNKAPIKAPASVLINPPPQSFGLSELSR